MEDLVVNKYRKNNNDIRTVKNITKKILTPINTNKSYRNLINSKNYSRISLPEDNDDNYQNTSNTSLGQITAVDREMDKKSVNIIKKNLISRFKRSPYFK